VRDGLLVVFKVLNAKMEHKQSKKKSIVYIIIAFTMMEIFVKHIISKRDKMGVASNDTYDPRQHA
jgi:hypothetical protein